MVHFLPPFHTFQRLRTWTPSVPSWAELVAAGRRHGTSLRPAAWPGKATGGRIRWTRRSNGDISILIIFNTSFTLYTLYTLYIYIYKYAYREGDRERERDMWLLHIPSYLITYAIQQGYMICSVRKMIGEGKFGPRIVDFQLGGAWCFWLDWVFFIEDRLMHR